jgi:hypothetical protein
MMILTFFAKYLHDTPSIFSLISVLNLTSVTLSVMLVISKLTWLHFKLRPSIHSQAISLNSYTVNFEKPKNAKNCLAILTDVEVTVSFFLSWSLIKSGIVYGQTPLRKRLMCLKFQERFFMGGCSSLGLRTQKMHQNPNPVLTEP